jgi:hypothetical protein
MIKERCTWLLAPAPYVKILEGIFFGKKENADP